MSSDESKNSTTAQKEPSQIIEVSESDLPISCPMPDVTLWNQHPRVFIPIENGEGHCPYCGNLFRVKS